MRHRTTITNEMISANITSDETKREARQNLVVLEVMLDMRDTFASIAEQLKATNEITLGKRGNLDDLA